MWGGSVFGIYPLDMYRRVEMSGGYMHLNESYNDPSVADVAGQYQQAVYGRTLFNNVCSHCHGTDGASPVSERDLRKLQRRYKDNWKDTALTTIKNGRQDAGMPSWRATYSDPQIEEVLGFLATIQR